MTTINLTKNMIAIIDEEDYQRLSQYNWHYLKTGYAATSVGGRKNRKMIYMHRFIMGVIDSKISIDHINRDKIDNRKANLRICTHKENCANIAKSGIRSFTSKFKGVHWDKERNSWMARIGDKFIGRFASETEAAMAYNKMALKNYGEFACLNII